MGALTLRKRERRSCRNDRGCRPTVRVMPPCMAMGQAAGTAAALCVKTGSTPRTLDAASLVKTLKAQGAFLG